jgi:NAD+ kinase
MSADLGGDQEVRVERVGIVANPKINESYLERLVAALKKKGVEVDQVSEPNEDHPAGVVPDLVFVLGGDGTMLHACRRYQGRVLLGVDLGEVGFMAGMRAEELENGVETALAGELYVQEYRMLEVRVKGEEETRLAANEATLAKRYPYQTCSIAVSIEDEELFSFPCDGYIAATPLGSTAYALAAGGSIISGGANCYQLVPIAPHSLTSRPLVIAEDQTAELSVTQGDALLALDGGEPQEISTGEGIKVELSGKSVKIGRIDKHSWWRAVRDTFL